MIIALSRLEESPHRIIQRHMATSTHETSQVAVVVKIGNTSTQANAGKTEGSFLLLLPNLSSGTDNVHSSHPKDARGCRSHAVDVHYPPFDSGL